MQKRLVRVLVMLTSSVLIPVSVMATEAGAQSHDPTHAIIRLSPKLKQALMDEMRALNEAMPRLVVAVAAGDWHTLHDLGRRVRDGFIMKQALSGKERAELHRALPAGFLQMDAAFHEHAGRLAQAAAEHDGELVAFYSYRLMDGCIRCHATYASGKFPGFGKPAGQGHRH